MAVLGCLSVINKGIAINGILIENDRMQVKIFLWIRPSRSGEMQNAYLR